jgi:hypothetical protein
MSWWGGKVRQVRTYLDARVSLAERAQLATTLTPAQLALFDAMHVADQRHGLEVMSRLRVDGGSGDRDLELAGLFHDAAKGPEVGLLHRVSWSLGERYGPWVWELGRLLPGFGHAYARLEDHAEESAREALAAGCSERTAALIRAQAAPTDEASRRLHTADEAS